MLHYYKYLHLRVRVTFLFIFHVVEIRHDQLKRHSLLNLKTRIQNYTNKCTVNGINLNSAEYK